MNYQQKINQHYLNPHYNSYYRNVNNHNVNNRNLPTKYQNKSESNPPICTQHVFRRPFRISTSPIPPLQSLITLECLMTVSTSNFTRRGETSVKLPATHAADDDEN
ncbi:hypothetical protein CDAR_10611 [Caerostris darwini]|uniref:Uncharacterized protein n=1 Tax=Caerostris darwini TaxID=1538125 RepID=A0AAV4X3T5_9ARAC|nr:hypothetical protein CDAR_10611 [Caerostris darwini]